MLKSYGYPFTALVGQEELKEALLIALVNPKAGGLLIGGKKGTAKTTAARGAVALTEYKLINLPLNITEDMLFGSIDVEHALKTGQKRFAPGLLARANGNVIYIDEVNLLRQELLITLLDANISGTNIVERDGVSFEHATRYTVIATMNPQEGTLANHVLDRFGMYVDVQGEAEQEQRIEIMQRVVEYEANAKDFVQKYACATAELKAQVEKAVLLLPKVVISDALLILAAQMCTQALCAGHRADIYLLEAARAWAALQGRSYVLPKDLDKVAVYVLAHRMRQEPQQQMELPDDSQEQPEEQNTDSEDSSEENENAPEPPPPPPQMQQDDPGEENQEDEGEDSEDNQNDNEDNKDNSNQLAPEDQVVDVDKSFRLPRIMLDAGNNRVVKRGSGKRSLTRTDLKQGRYVRAELPKDKVEDLAFDATIRAAAPYQRLREKTTCALNIAKEDMRQKVREKRIGNTFLFAVDASGSMGAKSRMRAVKGAIFCILQEAYQKRDRVGMIAFRREKAEVILPITRSVDMAQKCLAELPTGGKTPLADGLACSLQILSNLSRFDNQMEPILVLVTDGRANACESGEDPVKSALDMCKKIHKGKITSIVIDTENDFIKLGLAQRVAQEMGANYYSLTRLSQEEILRVVRNLGD